MSSFLCSSLLIAVKCVARCCLECSSLLCSAQLIAVQCAAPCCAVFSSLLCNVQLIAVQCAAPCCAVFISLLCSVQLIAEQLIYATIYYAPPFIVGFTFSHNGSAFSLLSFYDNFYEGLLFPRAAASQLD